MSRPYAPHITPREGRYTKKSSLLQHMRGGNVRRRKIDDVLMVLRRRNQGAG